MKTRLLVVIGIMMVFGIAVALRPAAKQIYRTEDWLEDATPTSLGAYQAMPGPPGEKQTYRMSKLTYDTLGAFGIVTRIFTNGSRRFDVCVIASNTRVSFHDPTFCFPGQDWNILNRTVHKVPTKTHGVVPFALMKVQHVAEPPVYAAYTYKGPTGMVSSQTDLYMQWSLLSFVTGDPQEGAFYRFIALDSQTTQDDLLKFAADYMDKVKQTSNGIL